MENVKIRLVKERRSFKNEEGKEIKYYQYSLLFNDDLKTPIKPIFKNGKATLQVMAERVENIAKKQVTENKSVEVEEDDLPF